MRADDFTRKVRDFGVGAGCSRSSGRLGTEEMISWDDVLPTRPDHRQWRALINVVIGVEVEIARFQASKMTCRSQEGVADCGLSRR